MKLHAMVFISLLYFQSTSFAFPREMPSMPSELVGSQVWALLNAAEKGLLKQQTEGVWANSIQSLVAVGYQAKSVDIRVVYYGREPHCVATVFMFNSNSESVQIKFRDLLKVPTLRPLCQEYKGNGGEGQ